MRDVLGPGTILGYCTNVHAGNSLDDITAQLEKHALPAKERVLPTEPMGVGLWFPAHLANELVRTDQKLYELRDWLGERGLLAYTVNGFPHGDFHARRVKHRVYHPNWAKAERLEYTVNLAALLGVLLPKGSEGSISTLPIGWSSDNVEGWTHHVGAAVARLAQLRAEIGTLIHLDFEPEPGCVMQRSDDVVLRFEQLLLNAKNDEDEIRRHVRVCHDICHAAVMFEDQADMFARYHAAGINVGKVQISNAVAVDFTGCSPSKRTESLAQLRQFSEDRYLHQTMVRAGKELSLFEDLPLAFDALGDIDRVGQEWRTHFHVPVFLESFGMLHTTRDYILECMQLLNNSGCRHWEVETYSWNVLPPHLRVNDLAEGIAKELLWVKEQAAKIA